ncbi:MAG: tRNA lysidine(34) synthetase TilS [Oscillospiraceae bacterium]|nr:tRNA lysidine(34) synthetase TilS [Oscillospiraceae bacterium]
MDTSAEKNVMSKVEEEIRTYGLFSSRIMCALSGGADSVCLLLCLKGLSEKLGFELSAGHVNHMLRGEESDRDEVFARELCRRENIPFRSERADVGAYQREHRLSLEEAAREVRYGLLRKMAEGAYIATAHNLDDNAETVIFNLIRGTGLKGICGIPHKRADIIRPLLSVSRSECELFLRERSQEYVTDSTNLKDDYTRNKIRHNIMPLMREINPLASEAARRLSGQAEENENYFEELLSSLSDKDAVKAHPAVRKKYIARRLKENGIAVNSLRVSDIDSLMESRASTRYSLSGETFAILRKGVLSIEQNRDIQPFYRAISSFPADTELKEYGKRVKIFCEENDNWKSNDKFNKKLTNNCLDYDKIQGGVIIRTKTEGDKITLAGRDFRTSLKKLYNSLGLSASERKSALVLADENGLIWSEYGGVSDKVRVSEETRRILRIEVTYEG